MIFGLDIGIRQPFGLHTSVLPKSARGSSPGCRKKRSWHHEMRSEHFTVAAIKRLTLSPIIMEVENKGLEDDFSLQGGHFPLPWLLEERYSLCRRKPKTVHSCCLYICCLTWSMVKKRPSVILGCHIHSKGGRNFQYTNVKRYSKALLRACPKPCSEGNMSTPQRVPSLLVDHQIGEIFWGIRYSARYVPTSSLWQDTI